MSLPMGATIPAVYPGQSLPVSVCNLHQLTGIATHIKRSNKSAFERPRRCVTCSRRTSNLRESRSAIVPMLTGADRSLAAEQIDLPPLQSLLTFYPLNSDIITKASFENAIIMTTILGGSTNSVLHLIAMARSAGIDLTVDDFTRVGGPCPVLGNLKPSGDYVFEDLHKIGGIPSVIKYLLANTKLLDGSQLTVTGKTLAENVADGESLPCLVV